MNILELITETHKTALQHLSQLQESTIEDLEPVLIELRNLNAEILAHYLRKCKDAPEIAGKPDNLTEEQDLFLHGLTGLGMLTQYLYDDLAEYFHEENCEACGGDCGQCTECEEEVESSESNKKDLPN